MAYVLCLLPLPQGVASHPIKGIEVLRLYGIHVYLQGLGKYVQDIVLGWAFPFHSAKPTSPVVRAKGFLKSLGPYFYPSVGDHGQLEGGIVHTQQLFSDKVWICALPVHKNIYPHQHLFGLGLSYVPGIEISPLFLSSTFLSVWGTLPKLAITASANSLVPTFWVLTSSL
jgi:hypothetical protein